jgi:probable serine/threonine-protein kinase roco9
MSKNVLREIIILLLLTLAIILLLGVLLYEYVPMNKVIPETVTYTATDETRKSIEEQSAQDDGTVVLSYEVTSTDLKNYKKVNDYKAGRKNPFSTVNTGSTSSTGTNNGNTGTAGNNSSTTNSNNENNSTTNNQTNGANSNNVNKNTSNSTNYYPDKGIK